MVIKMAKLRKGLNEDTHLIKRGKFETETAKTYLMVLLITFHIIPIFFVCMGEKGVIGLYSIFLNLINIIVLFIVGVFYGIRIGYNFKFPLIMTVIAILSYLFYYNGTVLVADGNARQEQAAYIVYGVIYLLTYAAFSFFSTALGGFAKRFF